MGNVFISLVLLTGIFNSFKTSAQSGDTTLPVKISHMELLFVDLIRDLGARKGEREWNIGFGSADEEEIKQ